jgi:hypothetical protein
MHKHVTVVIAANEAGAAFEIADRIRGFVRLDNQIAFEKGHFLIDGIQTGKFTPVHPVVAVANYTGEVECTSDCASLN